jgi:hypothetical protein
MLECFGGPLDGQQIEERGLFFRTIATLEVVREGTLVYPAMPSGDARYNGCGE